MAEPPREKVTVTVLPLASESSRGKDILVVVLGSSPSVTAEAGSPMETVGWPSSSVMVPVPSSWSMAAFVALDSCTMKVSSASSNASWVVWTSTVLLLCPAVKVRVWAVDTAV